MNPIVKKLLRDSRIRMGKTLLLLLSLWIAFLGVSFVFYGNIMVDTDFRENFSQSNPSHLTLTYTFQGVIDKEILLAHPSVEEAEERPVSNGEIQTEDDECMPAIFFGVEDVSHSQINRFTLLGEITKDKVCIEQNGRYFFEEKYLRNSRIISSEQDTLEWGSLGLVHDTRLPPARMEHLIFVFVPIDQFYAFFPNSRRTYLIRLGAETLENEQMLAIGEELSQSLKTAYGFESIVSISSQTHPHQNIADGLSYLMKFLGGNLSVVGWIFMVLMLLTWLYPQIPDIGTMKSIGSQKGMTLRAYFYLISLIVCIAYFPVTYVGYKVAEAFNAFIAFTQNFEPVKDPVALNQFLLLWGICMAIPLFVAMGPIYSVVKRPARVVQNRVFRTPSLVLAVLNRVLSSATSKYVGNNLIQSFLLLLLTIFLIVIGLSITFTGANLRYSLQREIYVLKGNAPFDYALAFEKESRGKIARESWPSSITEIEYIHTKPLIIYNPLLNLPYRVTCGYLPPNSPIPDERMIRGTWDASCWECIYVSQGMKRDFSTIQIGDSLSFREVQGEKRKGVFGGVIKFPEAPMAAFRPSVENSPWNMLFIQSNSEEDLTRRLKTAFNAHAEKNPRVHSSENTRQIIYDHLEGSFLIISALGILALVLSLVGILLLTNLTLKRRERDIGILKAIGAENTQILKLFQAEILWVLGIAIVIAIGVSIYSSKTLCYYFGDMVLHFPLDLEIYWTYILVSIGLYIGLLMLAMRWLISKRLQKRVRYLVQ